MKIRRLWGLVHVKSYVVIKGPPASGVRKFVDGGTSSVALLIISTRYKITRFLWPVLPLQMIVTKLHIPPSLGSNPRSYRWKANAITTVPEGATHDGAGGLKKAFLRQFCGNGFRYGFR
ncbi:hypothetical protein AVEN_150702-1 [Araneus ventricosus]|uniref:Uncharacterized protein n=1 Tax=Araneus ventricosus TaxID=182803 RepID=A0A4Y2PCF1_ARAVE|nr:hypothetical protein AVEN_150702-1 [Araneus ventricosus]